MAKQGLSRALRILRQEGPLELVWRTYRHVHLRKRFCRHPYLLSVYTKFLQRKRRHCPNRYTDANPFKIFEVDPTKIEHAVENISGEWGTVTGGVWDRTKFTDQKKYRILKKRFVDGKSWDELPMDTRLGNQKDRVYHRIRADGYMTQRELEAERSFFSLRDTEIGVGIDRDGTIVHIGRGKHRLSIAKLLKLEQVPVQVRVRHTDWQYIRDEIRTTDDKSDLSDRAKNAIGHPDLEDLLDNKDWE